MKTLVVPVDFSPQTESVIEATREIAGALQAEIWLIHVAEPDPDFVGYAAGPQVVRDQVARSLREEHSKLHDLGERLRGEGHNVTALAVQGPTIDTILMEVEKHDADLVIMGSHGHGALYRVVVGSVSEGVLHRSPCPVLIVPPEDRT